MINRDINLLAPIVQDKLTKALAECHGNNLMVEMFEGFRTPERQEELYAQGRTKPGRTITQARAWQSFHQYGLAQDICFNINGHWTWGGDWAAVKNIFTNYGFESLKFEKPHFQITGGYSWQEALDVTKKWGLQELWVRVASRSRL